MAQKLIDSRTPDQIRAEVQQAHPWILETGQKMVMGCDLDALISAAFMHHYFDWEPIGVYNLKAIYAADGATNQDLKDAIWVDLDIARADIRSIGHHILTNHSTDVLPEFEDSINPNLLRGISLAQFARKYPLSTLHLLRWLTNTPAPSQPTDPYLLWLPDSTWIIAQKYVPNVTDWLQNWLPHPFLLSVVQQCQTEAYEAGMMKFLGDFAANIPLSPGRGQIASKWLGIHGYQCRYDSPALQGPQVQQTLNYLAQLANWKPITFPKNYRQIAGVRNRHNSDLAEFLLREEVFSYALPNVGVINYTSFDNF